MLNPWKRTVSQLSMPSVESGPASHHQVYLKIVGISGPFYDRHMTYSISMRDSREPLSSPTGPNVVRRYKDFEWIHSALMSKYPFRAIPSIPKKSIALTQASSSTDAFLSARRRGLEDFLFLVVSHPVLRLEPLVDEFLHIVSQERKRTCLMDFI